MTTCVPASGTVIRLQQRVRNRSLCRIRGVQYDLTAQLTLIAGLRLERFEDDYSDSGDFSSDNSDKLWNGEISARYTLSDNTMLYATVASSQKPGGVNTTASANQPLYVASLSGVHPGKIGI